MPTSLEPEPAERRARHAGTAHDENVAACRAVVAGGALRYIAHFTSGVFDFAAEAGGAPGGPALEARDRAGQRLGLIVSELDEACQPLDSGPLIRVVVQGEAGAMFHYLKLAGQSFAGFCEDGSPAAVDRADRQMAQLTEKAVGRLGAASMNWGGFQAREQSGEFDRLYQNAPAAQAAPVPHVARDRHSVPAAAAAACKAALNPADLHYAGIYHLGQPAWYADILDAPELAPFFQRVTPQFRRTGYAELIRQVHLHSRGLTQLLATVHSRQLTSLVLDAARGAVYVMPLSRDDYLVGVTLTQSQVARAHGRFKGLYERVRDGASSRRG
jgi:hypothetical protein